jgi:leader peptidase (prepilin peptidase)/N-methyltransferase
MPDSLFPVAILVSLVASLFGLVVGSFANVVIHRLPREESIVFPSSRCPRCGAAIRPWQNIPVFSWLLLGGRCASCREPISPRYPVVELLHGAGFGLVVWNFGPQPFTLLLLLFFFALVVLAFIDWDHQILPDVITLPGILIGILGSLIPGALIDWREASLAAFLGYAAFFLIAEGYARLRGIEGLGQGDWKLAAMMGSFLGGQRLMLTVLLASVSGMTYGLIQATRLRRQALAEPSPAPTPAPETLPSLSPPEGGAPDLQVEEAAPHPVSIGKYKLPFGTFLAASAVFVLFCGDSLLRWYGSLFWF